MRFFKRIWAMIPALFAACLCVVNPAHAVQVPAPAAEIIFTPGTGDPQATPAPTPIPFRTSRIACADLAAAQERLSALYGRWDMPVASAELADASPPPPQPANRLDRTLLETALASYKRHVCSSEYGFGPGEIVVVDFARPSSQPRLYVVNLLTGFGTDTPIRVAHGVGSDPDDDGIAERFSNAYNSLASSLGAARGSEMYSGRNGLSLRLDGLDPSNSMMRTRDIVAHSYSPERRRYFNASLVEQRGGKPGASEGCFVVAPEYRDWLFSILGNGGFLFAGLGGDRAKEMLALTAPPPVATGPVIFVEGTGN